MPVRNAKVLDRARLDTLYQGLIDLCEEHLLNEVVLPESISLFKHLSTQNSMFEFVRLASELHSSLGTRGLFRDISISPHKRLNRQGGSDD